MDIVSVAVGVTVNQIIELFKGPKEQIAAILSSPLLQYRLMQDIKVLQKAKELVIEHGISVKALNLKILAPLIENAVLEDEPVLQELWANLIANTLDSDKNYNTIIFINLLKEITKQEAELLVYLSNSVPKITNKEVFEKFPSLEPYMVINLKRVGLMDVESGTEWNRISSIKAIGGMMMKQREFEMSKQYLFDDPLFHSDYKQYLTPLGKEFLKAVTIVG